MGAGVERNGRAADFGAVAVGAVEGCADAAQPERAGLAAGFTGSGFPTERSVSVPGAALRPQGGRRGGSSDGGGRRGAKPNRRVKGGPIP